MSQPITQELPTDERFAQAASAEQIARAAESLRSNGFTVHTVQTLAGAHNLVAELLPTDKAIFTATSQTLVQSGLENTINASGAYRSMRAEQANWDFGARHDEVRMTRSAPDVVVGSVHAVTEDGKLLIASASGSQLAPYASGAARAIWVVGAQKVVPDTDTGLRRIETYSCPMENTRAQQAYNATSVIAKVLIINRETVPGRGTVVLSAEAAGF